jgi:hypothetical protein
MTMAAIPQATAATGAGGLTILYASSGQQAHQCNVIGGDSRYQAVVCSDIVTAEDSPYYWASGRAEVICQSTSTPHIVGTCLHVNTNVTLEAGDGTSTGNHVAACDWTSSSPCPTGDRFYVSTRDWVYKIGDAEGGRCSANLGSSYVLWNVVWGSNTAVETADGAWYYLHAGVANDGSNESSGHYFICP